MKTGYAIRSRRAMRGVGVLAASAALAGAGLLLPATTAQAADIDLTCALSVQGNFSPPLSPSNPSSTVSVPQGALKGCTSPNGKFSQLKSADIAALGSATADGPFAGQCPAELNAHLTGTFTWNNGQTSGFTFTLTLNITKGTVQLSGTVTSGPMAGATIAVEPAITINTDCAFAGLERMSAVAGAVEFVA